MAYWLVLYQDNLQIGIALDATIILIMFSSNRNDNLSAVFDLQSDG